MRRIRWLGFALLAGLFAIPSGEASAITGVLSYNGHWYKLYNTSPVTWANAKSSAASVGGYLCCPASTGENTWLVQQSLTVNTPWIGGTDETVEGTWTWVSGETWNTSNAYWNGGEPNNSGNEDYLTIGTTGGWNDWNSTGTAYYIVEWDTDPNLPADPTNLRTTSVTNSRIDLAWNDNSTGESLFELEKAVGASAFSLLAQPGADSTSYPDTGVTAETAYSYRIRAVNTAGPSGWSNTLNVTTAPPPATGLTATALTARSVSLTWSETAVSETGIEVERGNGSPGTGFAVVVTQPSNSTSYVDTGVQPERTYSYRVRVVGAGGKSAYSAEASVTTPLAAPTNVGIEGTSDTSVTLSWEDTSTGETGFEIERGIGCPAVVFGPLVITGPDATTYSDDSVLPERTYSYRVRALKTVGSSAWTPNRCVTMPPYAPTDAGAVSLSAGRVRITWTDVSKVETSYEVMRATAPNGLFERVAVVAPNVTQFVDTTAAQETSYLYRVAAVDDHGHSGWAVSTQVDTDAMLVVRKASVVRPKKAGAPAKLTATGEFDVGGRGVDVGAAASIGVGAGTIPVPALVHKGATYSYAAAGVRLVLKPAKGSSRVAFTLVTDESLVALPAADEALTVSYANGAFRAIGTVQLSGGAFVPPARGAYVDPAFNVVSVVASLKDGAKDSLTVKGSFHVANGTPASASEVHVKFGSYELVVPGTDFTRVREKWVFSERGIGSTSVTVDYAKGAFTVVVKGTDLGVHAPGADPVPVEVEFGEIHFADTPVMASTGKSVKY